MHSSFLLDLECNVLIGEYASSLLCVGSNTLFLTLNNFFGNPEKKKKDGAKEVKKLSFKTRSLQVEKLFKSAPAFNSGFLKIPGFQENVNILE